MIDNMAILNAKYQKNVDDVVGTVKASINGQEMFVPLDPANRHYAEILRQVAAGTLTIAAAD